MYSKSEMASRRVMRNAIKYLEGKLRLKVNVDKTEARSAKGSQMLGFVFTGLNRFEIRISKKDGKKIVVRTPKLGYCCPREKSLKHFKERVIEITDRSRGRSLEQVICELNSFLRGWINYYARSWISKLLSDKLLPWLRRRVRQYAYKLWKTDKSRKHNLRKYGVEEWKLKGLFCSSRSTWKMSMVMNRYMTNKLLIEKFGLLDCHEYYKRQHKTKMSKDTQYIACLERKEWENKIIS